MKEERRKKNSSANFKSRKIYSTILRWPDNAKWTRLLKVMARGGGQKIGQKHSAYIHDYERVLQRLGIMQGGKVDRQLLNSIVFYLNGRR